MKKCLHCGEICEDTNTICPKCGALVEEYIDTKDYMDVYHVNHGKRIRNKKLILWFLLGIILPYIGFLVSWIMYDSERDRAKAVLFGAIVSTVVTTLLRFLLPLFIVESQDGSNVESKGQSIKDLIDMYNSL